jgi:RNA polymerase sigma-70 factor (sigma-E family)
MPTWGAGAHYTRLIEQHGGALLHLAILLTGNRHDAEDIVQDAVLSVALAWPRVRPKSGFAYLKRAVTNRAIDVLRARKEIPTDAVPEVAVEDYGFLRHEEDRRFFALVDTLPLRQRATLVLRYYADMDDRTIAASLGCSVETVRTQVHHALTKLRAQEDLIGRRNR